MAAPVLASKQYSAAELMARRAVAPALGGHRARPSGRKRMSTESCAMRPPGPPRGLGMFTPGAGTSNRTMRW